MSRGQHARPLLSITGKGGKVRQVLLPEIVSRSLLSLGGDAGDSDPVFPSRMGGGKLTERNVNSVCLWSTPANTRWLGFGSIRAVPIHKLASRHYHHLRTYLEVLEPLGPAGSR